METLTFLFFFPKYIHNIKRSLFLFYFEVCYNLLHRSLHRALYQEATHHNMRKLWNVSKIGINFYKPLTRKERCYDSGGSRYLSIDHYIKFEKGYFDPIK